jgi:hypothetical protein
MPECDPCDRWKLVDKTMFRRVLPTATHTFAWSVSGHGDELLHDCYTDEISFFDGMVGGMVVRDSCDETRDEMVVDFQLREFPVYPDGDDDTLIPACFIHMRVSVLDENGIEITVLSEPHEFDVNETPQGYFGVGRTVFPVMQLFRRSDTRLKRAVRYYTPPACVTCGCNPTATNTTEWSMKFRATVWLYRPWDIMRIAPQEPSRIAMMDDNCNEVFE